MKGQDLLVLLGLGLLLVKGAKKEEPVPIPPPPTVPTTPEADISLTIK